jgi:hypothetical protein
MSQLRGKPFAPGNTMGRGRPRGSPNRSGSPEQDLLRKYGEQLTLKCISMAGQEKPGAMKLCMERILPVRRDAVVPVRLPRIRTAQDIDKAAERVTQSMARGKITATDGEKMMNVLEMRSRFMDAVEVESRIAKLEESMAATNKVSAQGDAVKGKG